MGLVIYGFSGFSWGDSQDQPSRAAGRSQNANFKEKALSVGVLLSVAARLYGIVNAPNAANRYNASLASRLGIDASLTMVASPDGRDVAWVPNLGGRF